MSATLVLSPRYGEDSNLLWRAAVSQGWRVERLRSFADAASLRELAPLVVYGETLMTDLVAESCGLGLIQPPDDWLPSLPQSYRLRSVHLSTVRQARELTVPSFIKPAHDKLFEARVYDRGLDVHEGVEPEAAVLVAEPVRWGLEVRSFILDRQVRTVSAYLRSGDLAPDWELGEVEAREAMDFLERLCRDPAVELPPAVVLDVGVIECRGWAVVEANPAWGSGLCGCDPVEVLEVLRRACVDRSEVTDRRYLRVP